MLSVMSQLRALKADTGADINVEGAQRFGCLLLKGRNAVLGGDCVRAQFPGAHVAQRAYRLVKQQIDLATDQVLLRKVAAAFPRRTSRQ